MSGPLWDYLWPVFAFGVVLALIGGLIDLRRHRARLLVAGALVTFAGAAVWHGPLGAADRFTRQVEASAQDALTSYEMNQVTATLHHRPLTRRLMLSGQADEFQRSELVRLLSQLPGVSDASWGGSAGVPLIVQGELASALGFLAGLLLAYGIESRRRYNAQWKW